MRRTDETRQGDTRQILGIRFHAGGVESALERMAGGGLLVVPAAPALKDLATHPSYRAALLDADVAIADSAFMVLMWNLIEGDRLPRVSGLRYLRALLERENARRPGNTFWVMAGRASAEKNLAWLSSQGIAVPDECVYLAPMYGDPIADEVLVERLERLRPQQVVITVGGGTQERLGSYLKHRLSYRPALHCIGAAIAFLSGDQVHIPEWADRLYLGWLLRCLSSPKRYIPRYLSAPRLLPLLWRYRSRLPVES
ncbi:MAG TPA: WecB/TagA/CpsF family glycosyltransferase [Terracidiphilus sp.]|nr:WecB/TagA/CpsF family glycosyltransferase [Terracidiphilus sp.]